ncbi:MAG: N-acetyl-gamma-glutamyl-phosphate reductase [Rhodothermales bacterium]|nr:N-acetyl-gamma-glutamyl-phosphate reductase [Rhodothermales bacterium]
MRAGVLHGAGYTGRELIRLIRRHPRLELALVTSRTFAGQPVWNVHPDLREGAFSVLRGVDPAARLTFTSPDPTAAAQMDVLFVAAEHGQGAVTCKAVLDAGFEGYIIDLSADFRLPEAADYKARYEREHPAPELAGSFVYGMADLAAPYAEGTRRVANPGCFATGLTLALAPLAPLKAHVTALTGASGSGARPKPTTHFPDREGNVRAYKVLCHQHMAEVMEVVGASSEVDFIPVSGPWTRGIWGTAHVETSADVDAAFRKAFEGRPLVRLWPDQLPELRWSVGTPYCDIGWVRKDDALVVGFALDNLLKGAASQAVHNFNLISGLDETEGLV